MNASATMLRFYWKRIVRELMNVMRVWRETLLNEFAKILKRHFAIGKMGKNRRGKSVYCSSWHRKSNRKSSIYSRDVPFSCGNSIVCKMAMGWTFTHFRWRNHRRRRRDDLIIFWMSTSHVKMQASHQSSPFQSHRRRQGGVFRLQLKNSTCVIFSFKHITIKFECNLILVYAAASARLNHRWNDKSHNDLFQFAGRLFLFDDFNWHGWPKFVCFDFCVVCVFSRNNETQLMLNGLRQFKSNKQANAIAIAPLSCL